MVSAANSLPCFNPCLRAVCARITLGNETYKTSTKDNAGGSAIFNEKLTFNKQSSETILKVGQAPSLLHVMHVCRKTGRTRITYVL
jgi:hypothetical protein